MSQPYGLPLTGVLEQRLFCQHLHGMTAQKVGQNKDKETGGGSNGAK